MSLADARVLVVGVGGLGCPAALVLARAGVGTLGLVDEDLVESGNLHRQILFERADVGRAKVDVAAEALARDPLARGTVVETHATHFLPANALALAGRYDVVVEGSDNFPTKFLVADAARLAGKPVVHGAAIGWHGTVLAVTAAGGPCYRCLFEDVPREHVPNCAEAGVMGPVVGVVGALMADVALAMLEGTDVAGELVTFDARPGSEAPPAARRRRLRARRGCALCDVGTIRDVDASRYGGAAPCARPNEERTGAL